MNSFVICQFSYCLEVWICHSRKLNARIDRLHERDLRVKYRNFDKSFQKLLKKESSVTLHQLNLQKLMLRYSKLKLE